MNYAYILLIVMMQPMLLWAMEQSVNRTKASELVKNISFGEYFHDHLFADFFANGGSVHDKDKNGQTILYWAVNQDKTKIQNLLSQGADCNIVDHDGLPPLFYAMKKHPIHPSIVVLLLQNGANPVLEKKPEKNTTALHSLAQKPGGLLSTFYLIFEHAQFTRPVDAKATRLDTKKVTTLLCCLKKINISLPRDILTNIIVYLDYDLPYNLLVDTIARSHAFDGLIGSKPIMIQRKTYHDFTGNNRKQAEIIRAITNYRIAQGKEMLMKKNYEGYTVDELALKENCDRIAGEAKKLQGNFEQLLRPGVELSVRQDLELIP